MASGDMTPGFLSASTNGKAISVSGTGSPGITVHDPAAGSAAPNFEQVTLYACNNHASATRILHIEWGATGTGSEIIVKLSPQRGMVLVADRIPIQGSAQRIRAWVDVAGETRIWGRTTLIEAPT